MLVNTLNILLFKRDLQTRVTRGCENITDNRQNEEKLPTSDK